MSNMDIHVPDIGDVDSVEVIEVLVSVGDRIALDESLITVESDKASMEVPASVAGVITSLAVDIGAKVKQGDVIAVIDADETGTGTTTAGNGALPDDASTATPEPAATVSSAGSDVKEAARPANANAIQTVLVPDIGESAEVEVIEILVATGDEITLEQSLVTLESDKASMEIPATIAGTVNEILVNVGDKVAEGNALVSVNTVTGDSAASADQQTGEQPPHPAASPIAHAGVAENTLTQQATAVPASGARTTSPTAHLDDGTAGVAHASPGVRRYAREHGAELALITGSGRKSRVLKEDVIAFIKQSMEAASSNYRGSGGAGGASAIPVVPDIDFSKFGDIERLPLGRINKLSARNLHRAWLNVPHVTHHDEADITEMEAFRKSLKHETREGDPKITGLAFHMKALVQTLKAYPKLNSSLTSDGESLIRKHYYHVGIAVDTPNGLVVPVFRDVDRKSISELALEMQDVSQRARDKKLKPDEMQGASMTISNLGGIGGTAFTPIVNTPEVAILGLARSRMQPVWNGSEFIPRLMCPVDLSYDHRVVDGADAARFVAHYCKTIGDVRRLLI